jgi:hypothetical protein
MTALGALLDGEYDASLWLAATRTARSTCQKNLPAFGNERIVEMERAHAAGGSKPWQDTRKQRGSSVPGR